jgi:hypothetical protein
MNKVFSAVVVGCFFLFTVIAASAATLHENRSCGNPFPATGWAVGYQFAYEIMAKGPSNFKVKTLVNSGGNMIHLECQRNLPSREAAIAWLGDKGYWLQSDGPESNLNGTNKTVDRGPLYKIPEYLYQ